MRIRAGVIVVALVAIGAAACGQGEHSAQTAPGVTAAPLTLPTPGTPGPGTTVDVGRGVAGHITPSATREYLSAVAAQTKRVNTGQFRLVTQVTGGDGHEGRTTTLTELSGAFDRDAGSSRIELDVSGANAAGGSGLSALLGDGPIGMIIVGSTGYLRMPGLLGGGDSWMEIADPDRSSLAAIFDMFKVEDIAGFVESLQCAGEVEEVGREDVDGVATTHYRATVDTAALETCRRADPNAGRLLDNFGDATSGTVEVWVDESSLVRKLVNTADSRALGSDLAAVFPGGTSTLTMTLTGFGEPLTIEAPPPEQVTEGVGGLGGLGGLEDLLGP